MLNEHQQEVIEYLQEEHRERKAQGFRGGPVLRTHTAELVARWPR
jgi:hypothetical protein